MKKSATKQTRQYDKIFTENIDAALPGLIKYLLQIDAVEMEELPDSLQHTKEREPDLLKKIRDRSGDVFVLQIEFQLADEPKMKFRMLDYYCMLLWKYSLPVKQYVIYLGNGRSLMDAFIKTAELSFTFKLLSLAETDYRLFLNAPKPEEKIFAILANFGSDKASDVINNIVIQVIDASEGDFAVKKHMQQLRILAQLRNLVSVKHEIMKSIAKYISEENDLLYQKGMEKGKEEAYEEKDYEFVKNLLLQTDFSISKIASLANVPEQYVVEIKAGLNQ